MKSMCHDVRRNSPSVAVRMPASRWSATTSRIAVSSASRNPASSRSPARCRARASSSAGGRSRLPTWSARKGGSVRAAMIRSVPVPTRTSATRERDPASTGSQLSVARPQGCADLRRRPPRFGAQPRSARTSPHVLSTAPSSPETNTVANDNPVKALKKAVKSAVEDAAARVADRLAELDDPVGARHPGVGHAEGAGADQAQRPAAAQARPGRSRAAYGDRGRHRRRGHRGVVRRAGS